MQQVNLARKLRPQGFDEVIGQDIPIRMLKNSLYRKKFFPVYLFEGQRGCGKTTTARIFAAAVNCAQLIDFQQNPSQKKVPCLLCESCLAMKQGQHPDFLEIDAASHTGVDHARSIIETASYLPLLGEKKIYLIDEAHMLSKAAFNAFLKILEEPPTTALFMLATTELQKIPETILSRCFQITFRSVDFVDLEPYMQRVCRQEGITLENNALKVLAGQTHGCVRDMLNVLEQASLYEQPVTAATVLSMFGKINTHLLLQLFEAILASDPQALLSCLSADQISGSSPQVLWDDVVSLVQVMVRWHYGVKALPPIFIGYEAKLGQLSNQCSVRRLYSIMQIFMQQEVIFLQTDKKQQFLELVLLQLCESHEAAVVSDRGPLGQSFVAGDHGGEYTGDHGAIPKLSSAAEKIQPVDAVLKKNDIEIKGQSGNSAVSLDKEQWKQSVNDLVAVGKDQILNAIMRQASFISYDAVTGVIVIQLNNASSFFTSKVEESMPLLLEQLRKYFGHVSKLEYTTSLQQTSVRRPIEPINEEIRISPELVRNLESPQVASQAQGTAKVAVPISSVGLVRSPLRTPASGVASSNLEKALLVKKKEELGLYDKEKWPMTNLIVHHFPGVIKKINTLH